LILFVLIYYVLDKSSIILLLLLYIDLYDILLTLETLLFILIDFFFLPALDGYLINKGKGVYLLKPVNNFYYLTNPLK
jgi:hypothetical protein